MVDLVLAFGGRLLFHLRHKRAGHFALHGAQALHDGAPRSGRESVTAASPVHTRRPARPPQPPRVANARQRAGMRARKALPAAGPSGSGAAQRPGSAGAPPRLPPESDDGGKTSVRFRAVCA